MTLISSGKILELGTNGRIFLLLRIHQKPARKKLWKVKSSHELTFLLPWLYDWLYGALHYKEAYISLEKSLRRMYIYLPRLLSRESRRLRCLSRESSRSLESRLSRESSRSRERRLLLISSTNPIKLKLSIKLNKFLFH